MRSFRCHHPVYMCTSVKLDHSVICTATDGEGNTRGAVFEDTCCAWALGDEDAELIDGRTGLLRDARSPSKCSRLSLSNLYTETRQILRAAIPSLASPEAYSDAKSTQWPYGSAKESLKSAGSIFHGWVGGA